MLLHTLHMEACFVQCDLCTNKRALKTFRDGGTKIVQCTLWSKYSNTFVTAYPKFSQKKNEMQNI